MKGSSLIIWAFATTLTFLVVSACSYISYFYFINLATENSPHELFDRLLVMAIWLLSGLGAYKFSGTFSGSFVISEWKLVVVMASALSILALPQFLNPANGWDGFGPLVGITFVISYSIISRRVEMNKLPVSALLLLVIGNGLLLLNFLQFSSNSGDVDHNLFLINDDFRYLVEFRGIESYQANYAVLGNPLLTIAGSIIPDPLLIDLAFASRSIFAFLLVATTVIALATSLPSKLRWISLTFAPISFSGDFPLGEHSILEQLNLTSNRLAPFLLVTVILLWGYRKPEGSRIFRDLIIYAVIFAGIVNNLEFGLLTALAFLITNLILGKARLASAGKSLATVGSALLVRFLLFSEHLGMETVLGHLEGVAGGPISPIGPQIWIVPLASLLFITTVNLTVRRRRVASDGIATTGLFAITFSLGLLAYYSNISSVSVQLQVVLIPISIAMISNVALLYLDLANTHFESAALQTKASPTLGLFALKCILSFALAASLTNNGVIPNLQRLSEESSNSPRSVIAEAVNEIDMLIIEMDLQPSQVTVFSSYGNILSKQLGTFSGEDSTDPSFLPDEKLLISCTDDYRYVVTRNSPRYEFGKCWTLRKSNNGEYVLAKR